VRVRMRGGSRGMLRTPLRCGTYAWTASFTPWSAAHAPTAPVLGSGGMGITERCGLPFAPAIDAGMDNRAGGASGTFSFTFTRQDGEQWIDSLSASMPRGLLASLRGVPLCSGAQAATGTCPGASRIGSVDAAAGAGSPYFLERKGDAYLTEGYKGAPYGLVVKVPVEAGPFRGPLALTPITVRQALHVDRATAGVTVASDPFPQIWHGIPLAVRQATVRIDRPGFMRNPTDCSPKQVEARFVSTDGSRAIARDPFQATRCAGMRFKPKLTMAFTGKRQTRTGGHPGVRAQVTQAGVSEAGIKKAVVRLPKSLALDPGNAQALCEFVDGTKPDLENHCPKGSIVGRARAVTPLLNDPLIGNVYFVKNIRTDPKTGRQRRTLPMLVVALRGEIAVNLRGQSSTSRNARLVNTFTAVPDAPITRFNLNIVGGAKGILVVTRTAKRKLNICSQRPIVETAMTGHNGRRYERQVSAKTPRCAGKRRAR
jgi:hypothetical protein